MRTHNYVLFKPWGGRLFNDELRAGNTKLVLDTSFDPQRHINICGTAVVVPERLSRVPIGQWRGPQPPSHDNAGYEFEYRDDIAMEVRVGDKIYTHFNVVFQQVRDRQMIEHEGEIYFKAPYEMILCAVRDEQIIMIGGWVLVEPDMETWDEILLPTYYPVNGVDGKPMPRPKKEWILTKVEPEARYLHGFVRGVGTPLRGWNAELSVGDRIVYHKNADWSVKIEGRDYYLIRQRHVLAKYL